MKEVSQPNFGDKWVLYFTVRPCLCLCFCLKELGNKRGGCFMLSSSVSQFTLQTWHWFSLPPVLPFSPLHGYFWEGSSPAGCFAQEHMDLGVPAEQQSWAGWQAALQGMGTTKKKKKKNQQWLMRFPPQGCCGVFLLFAPCATSDSAAPGAALPWKQRSKPMQEMQFKWTQSTQSLPCSSFSSLQVSRLACCWCWGGPGQAWFSLHFIFFGGAESWTQGVLTNSGSESSSEQRAAFTCLRSEERTPEQCQSRVG